MVSVLVMGVAALVTGASIGGVLTAIAVSVAASALSSLLAPKESGGTQFDTSLNVTSTAADTARQIIYGETSTGGTRVFMELTGDSKYLHIVNIYAAHEIDSFGTIKLDDNELMLDVNGNDTNKYSGYCRVKKHLGAWDQAADADLVSECPSWTTDHRLRGLAYLYIRLKWNADLFSGIPNITAVVKGRKVYDPREEAQDPDVPSSWAWSNNAALCILDYFRGVPLKDGAGNIRRICGVNAPDDRIAMEEIAAEATICDEAVAIAEGGTQARYTIDGVVSTDTKPEEAVTSLLTACMGQRIDAGGLLSLRVAAARTAALEFDESDLIGPISVQPRRPLAQLYNGVKGTYRGPETNYDIADVPPFQDSTLVSLDGRENWLDVKMPYTSNGARAQRLQSIALSENRRQMTAELPMTLKALKLRAGDWFLFTSARRGWSSKSFRVNKLSLAHQDMGGGPFLGVSVSVQEIDADYCSYSVDQQVIVSPPAASDLPNPLIVPKPLDLLAEIIEFFTSAKVKFSATPAATGPDVRYLFDYREIGAASWITVASETPETYVDLGLGSYEVRVRSTVVPFGGVSAYEPDASGLAFSVDAPRVVPRVTNLEVVGGEGANEFLGPDATVTWREGSVNSSSWTGGLDATAGADMNARDQWLEGFEVKVYAVTGEFLRGQTVTDTNYTYPLHLNRADAARVLGSSVPLRNLVITVQQRARYGQDVVMSTPQKISISNPAPAAITGMKVTSFSRSAWLDFAHDDDGDLLGAIVRASETPGFDAASGGGAVIYQGNQYARVPVELTPGTPLYVQVACYDAFGMTGLNWSSEIRLDATGIDAGELSIDSLSAINANLGDVRVGRLRRDDSTWVIDLDNKYEIMTQ